MDVIEKEIASRKGEIEAAVEDIFKLNMKITDWDVPEANDNEAAKMIVKIMQDKLTQITNDVNNGNYNNY